ncbi:MAG TPA: insulinase family protein [Kiritimatiellia bacterium]|nr:insulinase family protein [Kiritimatiellia bacterium]
MSQTHGFTLLREQVIPEIATTARLYRHLRTGAELMSLSNLDENKVFGITFRTPPDDHTGVAHILEHSVLCGSRNYPTKEPFVELLKGSLQTFLNAFTYPDKTCYPVASQNLKDFYNLIDIYMDAVLHPLLTRETYLQEAWHYEQESPDAPLTYKGVVFNEMKGVYASPESLLAEQSQRVLFPDVTYGVDYGGDPRHIPDLTWEQLTSFHARYYHPSNSRIYFYGDDDVTERLRRMDAFLSSYQAQPVDSAIPRQNLAQTPSSITLPYPSSEDDDSGHFVTVNWLLPDSDSPQTLFGLQLLSHVLAGTPASPLRKALIDSGLGEDVIGAGLETQIQQPYFSIGLKGIKEQTDTDVETLILQTLQNLVRDRIDRRTLDASLNTIEFSLREGNTGSYPRGLAMMIGALQTWLYDGDPFIPLQFEAPLHAIRNAVESGEPYFETLIQTYLIDNPHRVRLVLAPDPGLRARHDAEERQRLDAIHARLTPQQAQALRDEAEALKARQATPDTPQALATIPILSREDLDPKNRPIPTDRIDHQETTHLVHELPTQGIIYLDLGFNLQALPPDLLPYLPIWSEALFETGTATEDFVALSQRIGSTTGGLAANSYTSALRAQPGAAGWLFLRGKAMHDRLPAMLDILRDVIRSARLDLRDRVRQIVLEEKASMEGDIIPSGHRFAAMRLRASLTSADHLHETLGGLSYFHFLRSLIKEIDTQWDAVAAKFAAISQLLFTRTSLVTNLTCSSDLRSAAFDLVQAFARDLPDSPSRTLHPFASPQPASAPEGWTIPSQVNYVGAALPLYAHGYQLHGSALVIARYIRSAWLWDQIRVQGGAYGGFSQFDPRSGIFTFTSYRDPNLDRSLSIYNDTADYLRNLWLSDTELTKAIIGTIGDFDSYMFPDAKGYLALTRHLAGDDDAYRQQLREEVLATTVEHFHHFGDILNDLSPHRLIAVLGSEEAIKASSHPFAIHKAL